MSIHCALIRTAGVLVPREQRPEWLAEWLGELWYVRRVRESSAFAFCLGAFRDALWLRLNKGRPRLLESPWQCGIFLTSLATASVLLTLCLPACRKALMPSPYRGAKRLVFISLGAPLNPAVSFEDYQMLARHTEVRFSALAFYGTAKKRVGAVELNVAMASGNLFKMLGIPVAGAEDEVRFVLSDKTWRKYFDGDTDIVGRVVDIGGQRAVVAGIVSADSWQLPGRMDAWLLEDKTALAALPPLSHGIVLGHLRDSGWHPHSYFGIWTLPVENDEGGYDYYDCLSLTDRARLPLFSFVTTLFYIGTFLSATTSLMFEARRLRQWIFLLAKVACILPILYCCGSLASAFNGTALEVLFFLAMFPGGFFALRWVFEDQRRRCPVCLRLLSKPVGFGEASHTFLGWYGTELTCIRGHGLLRVPEIPSTYFSTQRWLCRDDLLALR